MYTKKTHIHFIGIGGIGMSGIATILRYQGYTVSGCDVDIEQTTIKSLHNIGCAIIQGNNTPACHHDDISVVVYSSAISAHNTEILAAQARGIPTIPRAVMLAELMRTRYSVAISGSHGKTTTTSLIAHLLLEAHADPTIVIGGLLKNLSTNARLGTGDFIVVEADESDRSFLYLHATIGIVTNIDLEHLETYTDIDDIKQTFVRFLNNIPFYGCAIICADDSQIRSLLPLHHVKTITYGIDYPADVYATDITLAPMSSQFTLHIKKTGAVFENVTLTIPGKYNILNALAAAAFASELGIDLPTALNSFATFKGVERRFSFCGTYKDADVFDDYGHHPREIYETMIVARRRAIGKLIVIFQPHRYTRTQKLWDEFIKIFLTHPPDHLVITDIYPASESPLPEVTSFNFVNALKSRNPACTVTYQPMSEQFTEIIEHLEVVSQPTDLLLFQGAGRLHKLAKKLGSI